MKVDLWEKIMCKSDYVLEMDLGSHLVKLWVHKLVLASHKLGYMMGIQLEDAWVTLMAMEWVFLVNT